MSMMTRGIADDALLSGTWAKVGKSHYRRVTGEEVRKINGGWQAGDDVYTSRGAAIWAADRKYRAPAA